MANKTVAEEYAELKEKQFDQWLEQSFSESALKDVQLYEHKVPSGFTFKIRNVGMDFYAAMGTMPAALMETMLTAEAEGGEPKIEDLTPQQIRANIQTNTQVVRYMCVEPRVLVGEVNGHKNAISFGAITMADFGSLVERAKQGGDAAVSGLKTFRRKRK